MTRTAEWCIDYVSPYPYLQMPGFADLPDDLEIKPVPVLFAGLLGHWGQLGPAEIPAKKLHTFHYSRWLADKRGLKLAGPARHPFNPLALLRLTIALGSTLDVVRTIYDHTWAEGGDGQSDKSLASLADKLGVDDLQALVSTDEVKAQLRAKAEAAGLPAATLLREALGLTEARRRKPIPRVDPALVLAVGRIGGNLNQIARWLNRAMLAGRVDLDALTVARRLLTIERQLAQIVEAARRC